MSLQEQLDMFKSMLDHEQKMSLQYLGIIADQAKQINHYTTVRCMEINDFCDRLQKKPISSPLHAQSN